MPFGTGVKTSLLVVNRLIADNIAGCILARDSFLFQGRFVLAKI
jgi:hypothetical protein